MNTPLTLFSAATLLTATLAAPLGASSPATGAPAACPAGPWKTVERHYTITARIRPFLVWLSRHEVGDARLAWRHSAPDVKQLELLIGTDPDRAPMRINRWGYLSETLCGSNASLIGLMTESDEASLSEAQTRVTTPGATGQPFKAIRASFSGRDARTEIVSLVPRRAFTYRELDAVLGQLPAPGQSRLDRIDASAHTGFLAAIADMLHETVSAYQRSGRATPTRQGTYFYGGHFYDVALTEGAVLRSLAAGGRVHANPLQAAFAVRNRSTGEVSDFQMIYASSGEHAEAPLRVVYRPRWWLELELNLGD